MSDKLAQLTDYLSYDPFFIITVICAVLGASSALFLFWFGLWFFGAMDRVSFEIDDFKIYWREEGIHKLRVAFMFWCSKAKVAPIRQDYFGSYFQTSYLYEEPYMNRHERYNHAKAVLIALAFVAGLTFVLWVMGEL